MSRSALLHDDGTATFQVWAPRAKQVELALDTGNLPMEAVGGGWHAVRTVARHGDRYAYRLDGGPERPDPASRWQPDGVHGRSAVFDPATLPWSPEEERWRAPGLPGAVIYELHVGTFTPERTLDAAATRLAPLAAMGVTHVEVMPVNAFNGQHGWGYDGVAWYAVHEPYGGPAALARFVDAAHRHGMAVVLDVVYNHLGPSGNHLADFGPYLKHRSRTLWGEALNFDGPGSDEVRAFVVRNALWWLTAFHIDALRLDAVHGIVDTSAVHLLTQLADAVAARAQALRRPLALIAESDRQDPRTITPRAAGGQGMDAQWADDLHHAIHVAVTGERDGYYVDYGGLPDVAAAYTRGFVYDGCYSVFRDRHVGAPLADLPGFRLVTCLQNHDQVGNRPLGDRLSTLVDPALLRTAIVLLCASPTTPMLFMGEEYGERAPFQYFTSHPEPELAEAVRRGRREELAFARMEVADPQDPATLLRSTLDHGLADTEDGKRRRALWTDLLSLRRSYPALGVGRRDLVSVLEATHERLILIRADADGGRVLLAANLRPGPAEVRLPPGAWRSLLCSEDPRYGGSSAGTFGDGSVALPARSATLLLDVTNA